MNLKITTTRSHSYCRRCRNRRPVDEFFVNESTGKVSGVCTGCRERAGMSWHHADAPDGMAICRTCKEPKPRDVFRRERSGGHFYATQCPSCNQKRLDRKAVLESGNDHVVQDGTKICKTCKEEKPVGDFHVQRVLKDGRSTSCKECFTKERKVRLGVGKDQNWVDEERNNWRTFRVHGITGKQFARMLAEQDGKCPICECILDTDPKSRGRLNVDHDHKTGAIRGILCHPCNTKLGAVESPGYLKPALEYLRKHGKELL